MVTTTCWSIRVALAALCLGFSSQLAALGLGEIEVESSLNERFVGYIQIVDTGDIQAAEIIVSMASAEDFEKVGVERLFYLTNLKFEVVGSVVNVTSSQSIAEPYLNFIVEVQWPRGRMLKEYTVLLDPPTFSQAPAPAVSAPEQSSENAVVGRIQRTQPATQAGTEVTLAVQPSALSRAPQPAAPSRPASQDDTHMTTRNDTLWKIAERTVADESVTVNQQMLGIQRLNRRAFIKNNINLLKAGYVLRLPSQDEATEISSTEANAEVAQQIGAWRSGDYDSDPIAEASPATQLVEANGTRLKSQIDATASEPVAEAEPEAGQGEVRIVANSGALGVGSGTETDPSAIQLIEEKDTLNREVDDLSARLDREQEIATNQIASKDRQLDVKNQQIAELQEQLKESQMLAVGRQSPNQSSTPPPPTEWWASPTVLGGVIGVLVLILILVVLLFSRQRNRGAEESALAVDGYDDQNEDEEQTLAEDATEEASATEEYVAQDDDETEMDPRHLEPVIGEVSPDNNLADELELDTEFDDDDETELAQVDATKERSQTSDVIGEADIYIAYGRYGQAANLLLTTLNTEPERFDVRVKLLEVYVETSDPKNFAIHAEYIVENCDEEDVLHACRELESRFGQNELGFEVDPDEVTEETDADSSPVEADTNDDDLDSLDDVASVEEDAASDDSSVDEFQLEFDDDELEASDVEQTESAADDEPRDDLGDNLGGDLGIDFDPDKDVADNDDDTVEDELSSDGAFEDASLDDADIEDVSLDDLTIDGSERSAASATDDDFSFDDDDVDVNSTKLDLAEAYMDMGDDDGACDILKEVVEEGSPDQREKAQGMLAKIA